MSSTSKATARLRCALAALVTATALGMLLPGAAGAATVYYMSNLDGTIRTYQAGGSVTTIATVSPGTQLGATSVVVDSLHGYVYWSGQRATSPGPGSTGYVRRASAATGTGAIEQWTTTATGGTSNLVSAVTLDPTTQTAYWSGEDNGAGFLNTGNAAGATLTATATRAPAGLTSLALDTTSALIYWALSGGSGTPAFQSVSSASIGSGATTFANTNTQLIDSVAASATGSTLYWSRCVLALNLVTGCAGTGSIMQKTTSTAAGASTTLFGSLTDNTSVAVDADGCVLYTTLAGTVVRPANGACTAATLVTGGGAITSLWIVDSPSTTAPPTISGTTTPGSTFTCNDATWATDLIGSHLSRLPTSTRSYQWYFNGVDVGTDAPTYTAPNDYGVVGCEIQAENVAGTTTTTRATVTIAGAPGAPTGVTASAGAGQATVTWTAPASDNYSAITGYTVTASPSSRTCTSTTTSCTVTGLDAGTAYTFSVTATNGVGTSAASTASSAATTWSAPGAPTGVTAVRTGSGALAVSWTAPASNGGSAITGYTATASPGGKTCTATTTSCSISGLTNGTNYTFTVTATNAVGTGSASSASKASHPYATLKVTWRFSGRKATATWKAVTGEKKHVLTGGVRGQRAKSGSCSKRKSTVTCTITLPKGTDVLTASATTSARVSIAEGTKTKRIA